MAQDITSTMNRLLCVAASVRATHADWLFQHGRAAMARAPLQPEMHELKELVGDWDAPDRVETWFPSVPMTIQAWLTKSISLFPEKMTWNEARALRQLHPDDAERQQCVDFELQKFVNELVKAHEGGILGLRLLGIKYNLSTTSGAI